MDLLAGSVPFDGGISRIKSPHKVYGPGFYVRFYTQNHGLQSHYIYGPYISEFRANDLMEGFRRQVGLLNLRVEEFV